MDQISTSARDAIVEAAADLFAANGYHGTSMRQIAQAAGIAVGGIYNHFPSKEALFSSVILARHPIRQLFSALQQMPDAPIDVLLRHAGRRMAAAAGSDQSILRLIFAELIEFDGRHIRQLVDDLLPRALAVTQAIMDRFARLRPHPPVIVLRAFFGLVFSHAMIEIVLAGTAISGDQGALDQLLNVLFYGLLDDPPEA